MRTTTRALLASGALAVFGIATAAPVFAQENGTANESQIEEEAKHIAEANGGSHEDAECIGELLKGNKVDDCQEAPSPILPPANELIWGSISFVLLFVALAKFAFPAMKKSMAERTERIRTDLEGAESAKNEAASVLDEYRAQLADAKAEAGRIIEEARQQGEAVRRDQEARLQTELAGMRERAAADVESAKAQAIADLRGEVANLAIGAAEVVVGRNLDRDTQTQLVEQYIASVANRN
jgi:F-type H+-transporting ATPase subunit b